MPYEASLSEILLTDHQQTETNDVPLAVMAFQGRLVAGVGKALRIYDMGKKKLLRKVENKVRSNLNLSLFSLSIVALLGILLRNR